MKSMPNNHAIGSFQNLEIGSFQKKDGKYINVANKTTNHDHHHSPFYYSSFLTLSRSATWFLSLYAIGSFQRPSIISRPKRSFLTSFILVFKDLHLRLHLVLTCISKHLFIDMISDLVTWQYHVSCLSNLILHRCYL